MNNKVKNNDLKNVSGGTIPEDPTVVTCYYCRNNYPRDSVKWIREKSGCTTIDKWICPNCNHKN